MKPRHPHKTPTYISWTAMKQRCLNPKARGYEYYGGKGVLVCIRWLSFKHFLADMGERPAGASLDRIDNAQGYYRSNCRWASDLDQRRNRSGTQWITVDGRTQCLSAWCMELGQAPSRVSWRVRHGGLSWEQALTLPKRTRKGVPDRHPRKKGVHL